MYRVGSHARCVEEAVKNETVQKQKAHGGGEDVVWME